MELILKFHKDTCVVGHDNRDFLSNYRFFNKRYFRYGVNVYNIVRYYSYVLFCLYYFEIPSGIMVTASHNPKMIMVLNFLLMKEEMLEEK